MLDAMRTHDVLIVGGGLIGCALACELAKAKQRVAVVEKGEPGQEASQAAAGMLAPHAGAGRRTPFLQFLRDSLEMYPQFVGELESETGLKTEFRRCGLFYVVLSEDDEKFLEEKREWQVQSSIETGWVSAKDVRDREPHIGSCVRRALYFPGDCQVDNVRLFAAVLARARKLGVEFVSESPAIRVWIEKEVVRGVLTEKEKLESPVVVNAAGSWAPFDPELGFEIPVKPARGQIAVFAHHAPLFRHIIQTRRVYLVSRDDGRVLVGSTVESAGYEKSVTLKGLYKFSRGVLELNPELSFLEFRDSWAGLRPRAKDGLPIIGETPVKSLFLATGHFRNGILLAPLTARYLAELILTGQSSYDLHPFRLERFFTPQSDRRT
jgi:glycine oxidase